MGHSQSSLQDFISPFMSQMLSEDNITTLLSDEIHSLTYEAFLNLLGELNTLSKECLDADGKQLVFAVKKGSDSTVFWKATVEVACVKIDPHTQKVETFRLLNLSEFLKVFKTFKCQKNAIEQTKREATKTATGKVLEVIQNLNCPTQTESSKECCICLERQPNLILPCMHSYCTPCIEQWNEIQNTCPICREKLESTDDTWVLSEVPKAEEISKEIKTSLMRLAEDRSPPCSPS